MTGNKGISKIFAGTILVLIIYIPKSPIFRGKIKVFTNSLIPSYFSLLIDDNLIEHDK